MASVTLILGGARSGKSDFAEALAEQPAGPVLYVATASGWLWKSTTRGQTWTPLTDDMPTTAIGALALDPTDEDVVYAGTGEAIIFGGDTYDADRRFTGWVEDTWIYRHDGR